MASSLTFPVVPSNEIVPLPSNVSLPNELTWEYELIRWMVAFNVRPPLTLSPVFEPVIVKSLLSVTPLMNVPDTLFAANSNAAPSANTTVPPLIVPPAKFHEPVTAFNVSVVPVLVTVPVRFTTPPARVIVPIPAALKLPARLTVLAALLSMCSVPLLLQLLASVRTPPLTASIVPVLVKLLPVTLMDWPATLAVIVPLLTRFFGPEPFSQ